MSKFVLISALLAPAAFAQTPFDVVSFGVTGGVGLTDAFSDRTVSGGASNTHLYSPQKDYIVGPSIEVRLPLGFSVEADALYRRLNLRAVSTGPAGTFATSGDTNSWEFPILAKYKLGTPLIKPFIEAGPSFRHVSQFSGDSPHLSSAGATAGVGVELKLMRLRISPAIRYTHWGSDSNASTSSFNPGSHANQAEMLLGISY